MHDAGDVGAGAVGHVRLQPVHQLVHFFNRLRDRGSVLLAPAADLAVKVIAGLAKVFQALRFVIHCMQGRDDTVHFQVNIAALLARHVGQSLIPQHTALYKLHHIKSAADDRFVFAQHMHLCHWNTGALQSSHHGKFSFDGMR